MTLLSLITFAAEEAEESSQTLFYVAGGILVAFAVVVSVLGITRKETFPGSEGAARGVMTLAAVLVLATMAAAVISS